MNKLLNISLLHRGAVPALLVALLAAAPAQARQLSVEEALQAATAQSSMRHAPGADNYNLAYTAKADGLNTVYVFNRGEKNGYMIVAADDVASPVLGYADNGRFDASAMPENLAAWLENYSAQIAYAAANDSRVISAPARASFSDIAPIVKTLWDQGYPFNNDCPRDDENGALCYTGCVATAMAQVMKTYNWPEKGIGENTYFCTQLDKSVSFNYGETTFDWANMINTYPGNATQNAAVAKLMSACGVSVNMMYGTGSSGAFSQNVPEAFVKYFNYDKSVFLTYRKFYPLPTWMDMIYNELSGGYPIYYSGQAADGSGGHAFIIDGYRSSDGFVHVNWGWSGMSDGYYRITTLEPAMQGAGGAGAGFSDSQGAVFSLRKPQEGSVVYPNINVDEDFGTKSKTYFKNSSDFVAFTGKITSGALESISYTLGVRLVGENGGEPIYLWRSVQNTTKPGETVGQFQIRYSEFPTTGNYTVTPVFRYNNEVYNLPVQVGMVRSLKLEASASELKFSPIIEIAHLSASDIEVHTPVYAGKYARFSAKVTNTGAEYFGKIMLAFTGAGNTTQIYSYIPGPAIDLTEGESEEVEFVGSVPTTIITPDTYVVVATEDGEFISEKVKFKLNPHPAEEAVVDYVSSKFLNTFGGRGTASRPYIVTANPLSIEATFKCVAGEYFADYIIYWISKVGSDGTYQGFPSEDLTVLQGDEVTFTMNITDYSLQEGATYIGVFGYVVDEDGKRYLQRYEGAPDKYFRIDATAGVSDVTVEGENAEVYPNPADDTVTVSADAAITGVEVYSISGAMALNRGFAATDNAVELDVTALAPGMYVVKVNTLAGSVTTRLIKK